MDDMPDCEMPSHPKEDFMSRVPGRKPDDESIALSDLPDELLKQHGIKTTVRIIKGMAEKGWLDPYSKAGGYRQGVRLYFDDKQRAIDGIKHIYDLRGLGYKDSEIDEVVMQIQVSRNLKEVEEYITAFVIHDGKPYKLNTFPNRKLPYGVLFALGDVLTVHPSGEKITEKYLRDADKALRRFNISPDLFDEIQKRELIAQVDIVNEKPFFWYSEVLEPILSYVGLNMKYGLAWDTIDAIIKRVEGHINRYIFFPEIDEKTFTDAYVRWLQRKFLNCFSCYFESYLEKIDSKFKNIDSNRYYILMDYCSRYDSVEAFVADFIDGKCAFVFGGDLTQGRQYQMFLRRL